ncbi:pyridine nucleotide-disulfide oxidoreductase dimerization region [Thecamonas trahens ATCC 50062]|uniref:NAD(P)(+) transhydrogenase (Si-specific) n=1 Tax=Thecamonas trahens ATCC 50062 TaxID=461836 RepID=A0A0L0DF83_THETB|nr:pyridine nucleotide-disulfide oxidoreductase dimerization region [Thecamonas trahens ATCC 50062]KNC50939.1 pyridine nucleotide-disulfide oxidoreductase dimerization region [Thecamonas trahens ATCC 50062]|eukprot:XP_013756636.1 pyridine nucleotide-disulfide oxidoreductase dimerization region [Thecamonas trahens ATCC 50062]
MREGGGGGHARTAALVRSCAIAAAKKGKRVAVVDAEADIGGVCVHTGTIPSKTFREAILHLTGYRNQSFYTGSSLARKTVTVKDIVNRVKAVIDKEHAIVSSQLLRNHIDIIPGHASFVDSNTVAIGKPWSHLPDRRARLNAMEGFSVTSDEKRRVTADKFLLSVGTRPARPGHIPFEAKQVFDSDEMLIDDWVIPRTLIVVGAGVIGMEYASMMNIIPGSRVYVVDQRPTQILPFADTEMVEALCHLMRQQGARFLLGETVSSCDVTVRSDGRETVTVELASGKVLFGDALLYAVGRQANTDSLNLSAIGLETDKRGLISVDDKFMTSVGHVYAAGDCIGFPALASVSGQQGRLVADYMFDDITDRVETQGDFPYGIYTVPELSFIGMSERELTAAQIPVEVGLASYAELAKSAMIGGSYGLLKLLFCPHTFRLLGASAIGEGATEIIHVAQTAMALNGTIDLFLTQVFNYPSYSEAFRVAALNGLGRVARGIGHQEVRRRIEHNRAAHAH